MAMDSHEACSNFIRTFDRLASFVVGTNLSMAVPLFCVVGSFYTFLRNNMRRQVCLVRDSTIAVFLVRSVALHGPLTALQITLSIWILAVFYACGTAIAMASTVNDAVCTH